MYSADIESILFAGRDMMHICITTLEQYSKESPYFYVTDIKCQRLSLELRWYRAISVLSKKGALFVCPIKGGRL